MGSPYDVYRQQAEQCQLMALEAVTPELKAMWILKASDWLAMIPLAVQVTDESKLDGRGPSSAQGEDHAP